MAAERSPGIAGGFYGGIAMRDAGTTGAAMTLGVPSSALSRFAPAPEVPSSRALVYGGYRWANDVAVEATFSSADKYALRPATATAGRYGVGLVPSASGNGLGDLASRSWNVDVYTSWNFLRSFALYGRLGYGQADVTPIASMGASPLADARRLRDGMNYGVGLRYDMNTALGLRLEYGRFGRFAGEIGSTPLESDQVTFGLQFRF